MTLPSNVWQPSVLATMSGPQLSALEQTMLRDKIDMLHSLEHVLKQAICKLALDKQMPTVPGTDRMGR
jgi:hypothetical protein